MVFSRPEECRNVLKLSTRTQPMCTKQEKLVIYLEESLLLLRMISLIMLPISIKLLIMARVISQFC